MSGSPGRQHHYDTSSLPVAEWITQQTHLPHPGNDILAVPHHDERGLASHLRRPDMERAVKGPRRPCEVERNQALARRRIEELHKLFTSKHTLEATTLRHKLALVEAEYTEVFQKSEAVEEQHRALQRRLANEKEQQSASRDAQTASQHASEDGRRSEAHSSQTSVDKLSNPGSAASESEEALLQHQQELKEDSLRMQLEQTLRAQDEVVEDIRQELKEYEAEKAARAKWVEGLCEGAKDAELRKMRYRVRLGAAQDRSATLMAQLRASYVRMSELVRDRIRTEGEGAKNDAFLKYSETIHQQAQAQRGADTLENRRPLRRLKVKNQLQEEMEERAERLRLQLEQEAEAGEAIVEKCRLMTSGLEVLQQAWTSLPPELKHTLADLKEEQARFQGRWPPHPVNGIKRMRDCISSVDAKTSTVTHDTKTQLALLEPRPRNTEG